MMSTYNKPKQRQLLTDQNTVWLNVIENGISGDTPALGHPAMNIFYAIKQEFNHTQRTIQNSLKGIPNDLGTTLSPL